MNRTQFDWIREIQDVSSRFKEYFENLETQRPQPQPAQPPQRASSPTMPSDVYYDGSNVIVEIEAPGFRKEDLKIEFANSSLEVSGEKRMERSAGGKNYRQERTYGTFRKQISFPKDLDVDVDAITASYQDGVLRITLPQYGGSEQKISITIE